MSTKNSLADINKQTNKQINFKDEGEIKKFSNKKKVRVFL